jgi:hypothetical protein
MNCRTPECAPYFRLISQFKFIERLAGNKEATSGNKKSTITKTVLSKNQAPYSLLSKHGRHRHFYLYPRGFSAHRLLAMVIL